MKNAIVIGGLGGIGAGIANALAKRGFDVIIGDLNVNISTQSNSLYFVDATSTDSVRDFALQVGQRIPYLDTLVITIGAIDEGSILHVPTDKWKWMFDTNLFSFIHIVDAFLPLLEKSKASKIMLTGSGSGFGKTDPASGLGMYAICKHALVGYFKVLRDELKEKGIQVSLLVPSAIAGSLAENSAHMRRHIFKEDLSVLKGSQPKGRVLDDAGAVTIKFVEEFLNGKTFITNNPGQLIQKCKDELEDMLKGLS